MVFNSWVFALFLPIVLLCYYSLKWRWQNAFLVIASYFFYGWWDYRFCSLLAISTVIDYFCGLEIHRASSARRRKLFLTLSCCSNLAILGFFKYFNFFRDSFTQFFHLMGLNPDIPSLHIILPVGISFYTFQTMSYTIDVYRGQLKPTRNVMDFALYVSFFPQLVAGPIERAVHLLPQFQKPRVVDWQLFSSGCLLILIGLVRKIAIADSVAPLVVETFAMSAEQGSFALLIGLYLFSLQIYCDFAGYSDIARGVARLMGIELMENFQHPYFSTSITEFWRRWHISLSSWLRDYLYIPLGGNRYGTLNTYRNLFLTMLLGGLWHGASWTFVVWGGLHGLYLAVHKYLLGDKKPDVHHRSWPISRWPSEIGKMFLTFHLVVFTWIFFRAADFTEAWAYLSGLLAFRGDVEITQIRYLGVAMILLLLIDIPQYVKADHTIVLRWPRLVRAGAYAALILAIFALRSNDEIPFIYFQF